MQRSPGLVTSLVQEGGALEEFFLTFIPSGLMYTSTLKAIHSLNEIRFRVITAGLAQHLSGPLETGTLVRNGPLTTKG